MKKLIAIFMAALMLTGLLSGCMGTTVVIGQCTCGTQTEPTPNQPVEGAVKTGLAIVGSTGKSADGKADFDVSIVGVLVDDNGVIVSCIIDSVGTSVAFDASGITTDLTVVPVTKNELGDSYMMTSGSWKQQAAALAAFAVGKTVEELKNGALDASGKAPAGTDLASSASIYLGGYVSAIEKAVANAVHLGAQAGDVLKMATTSSLGSSKPATAEKDGTAQLDVDVAVITMNGDVITSCLLDALQAKVSFSTEGKIVGDVTAEQMTKNELGDNYMMTSGSWKQQAGALAAYATGKTVEELKNGAIDASGKAPVGTDLASSASIYLGGYVQNIEKAAK